MFTLNFDFISIGYDLSEEGLNQNLIIFSQNPVKLSGKGPLIFVA